MGETRNTGSEAKHRRIFELYVGLLEEERQANPERARYIGKGYFANIIAKDPLVALKPEYIARIISKQLKNGNK